jgi:predicted DNA-binding transcriptional regulator AlpA
MSSQLVTAEPSPVKVLIPASAFYAALGISRQTAWRREHGGDPTFPKPIFEGGRKCFVEAEAARYIDRLIAARDTQLPLPLHAE